MKNYISEKGGSGPPNLRIPSGSAPALRSAPAKVGCHTLAATSRDRRRTVLRHLARTCQLSTDWRHCWLLQQVLAVMSSSSFCLVIIVAAWLVSDVSIETKLIHSITNTKHKVVLKCQLASGFEHEFLSRVSTLTRDSDIAILSVCPLRSGTVFYGNCLTY